MWSCISNVRKCFYVFFFRTLYRIYLAHQDDTTNQFSKLSQEVHITDVIDADNDVFQVQSNGRNTQKETL